MSFQAKRELLAQVAPRYRDAPHSQKSIILDEFTAVTGYARKYAIRVLAQPVVLPVPITRPRPPRYGPAVQEARKTAWAAANFICAKRLIPFLPELVASLERHGHLTLAARVRTQLLAMSPATADRLLRATRNANRPRGIATTKAGTLLKHQIPIRTFTEWTDTKPGFFEIDLVAHCGQNAEGAYLYTLTITDVATGWTECSALLQRTASAVTHALDLARQLLPFPMLGIDSDNGSEFINTELLSYCTRANITFTRGRAYRKNDQCFVEQKNGAVVRQRVGYDRFAGEHAFRQLTEVYRAVRLYVNFFQPSMKLLTKKRDGSAVYRKYDAAQTPLQRVLAAQVLTDAARTRIEDVAAALDPVRLLHQVQTLQDALWRHAVLRQTPRPTSADAPAVPFTPPGCVSPDSRVVAGNDLPLRLPVSDGFARKRKYERKRTPLGPRTYRTRPDPFAAVNDEVHGWVKAAPERPVKSLFTELQQRYPSQFPDVQLRTLQRRVVAWRTALIMTFDDHWVTEDKELTPSLPQPLQSAPVRAADDQ